jgi:Fe-S cluster biogenesis protein NfuA
MTRRNPEVERLERENALLRRQAETFHRDPGDLAVVGCGDNSCVVAIPAGMATNGGCSCSDRTLRMALQYYKTLAKFRAQVIRDMAALAEVTL